MLKIRFQRIGKRHQPIFRLVVVPQRSKPHGKYVEKLGSYDPRTKQSTLSAQRIQYWLEQGVQLSLTAHNFLVRSGVLAGSKRKISMHTKRKEIGTETPPPHKEIAKSAAKGGPEPEGQAGGSI